MYSQPATAHTPALIVYLVDAGTSMHELCGTTTKIDIVNKAFYRAMQIMVQRSIRDTIVLPRYKISLFAYNSTAVVDVLSGIQSLPDLISAGYPVITAGDERTDMARGFAFVEKFLETCKAQFQYSPPPLVCHITDTPPSAQNISIVMNIVRRIQSMHVNDGPVLVENVYMAEKALQQTVQDWQQWGGILKEKYLADAGARQLYRLSSFLPPTYRQNANEYGYALQEGAANFFPGLHTELISLAFAASLAVPLK
jgi:hypothetical protein